MFTVKQPCLIYFTFMSPQTDLVGLLGKRAKQALPGVKGSIPTGALHAKNTRVCPPHGTHYNQVGRVRFACTSDKSNDNSLQRALKH